MGAPWAFGTTHSLTGGCHHGQVADHLQLSGALALISWCWLILSEDTRGLYCGCFFSLQYMNLSGFTCSVADTQFQAVQCTAGKTASTLVFSLSPTSPLFCSPPAPSRLLLLHLFSYKKMLCYTSLVLSRFLDLFFPLEIQTSTGIREQSSPSSCGSGI